MKQIRITNSDLFILEGEKGLKPGKGNSVHDAVLSGVEWIDALNTIARSSNAHEHFSKLIRSIPVLKRDEEQYLIREAKAGDMMARDRFLWHNLRLVVFVVRRFLGQLNANPAVEFMDLVQEGVFGLIRALDKYQFDKEAKFSTYAFHWVRQAVNRFIFDGARVIRLPVHIEDKLNKYRRATRTLEQRLGGIQPDVFQIAEELRCDPVEVQALARLHDTSRRISLDDALKVKEHKDTSTRSARRDFIRDNHHFLMEGGVDRSTMAEKLRMRMKLVCKNIKQYDILALRFGFSGEAIEDPTLEEVGAEYGVTRERVRQIEADGLMRLAQDPETVRLANEYLGKNIPIPGIGRLNIPTGPLKVGLPKRTKQKGEQVMIGTRGLPPEEVVDCVCTYYGVTASLATSKLKSDEVVQVRAIIYHILFNAGMALRQIGKLLDKSQEAVRHSYQVLAMELIKDAQLRADMVTLNEMLGIEEVTTTEEEPEKLLEETPDEVAKFDPQEVIAKVCESYGTLRAYVLSKTRNTEAVFVRHVLFYLLHGEGKMALNPIGKLFDRDHTSVLHGHQKIQSRLPVDEKLRAQIQRFKVLLQPAAM